jgi:hypothetical protein
MSMIHCAGCGRQTNTALSNHLDGKIGREARECYAAWEDGHYVKGCGYDAADKFYRDCADNFITRQPVNKESNRG